MKKAKTIHHCMTHQFTHQRGASLLEGIAYLGIAAIVVLGAVSLLTNAFGSAKANQMTEEVVALRTAVRKLYTGQPYPTDAVPDLVAANAIPNTLVITPGTPPTVTNSWGGGVTIAAANPGFTITYPSVPPEVCVSVISGSNGWTQINVNGSGSPITTFPATATQATTLCNAATNSIIFTAS